MEHRDSEGLRDRLDAGDAQWIRAGRGMLHAEQPTGGRHGLQLWTSLPPSMKFAETA
ncbi:MAG: pirin family protein [Xanthomonadaceae bacterium]|nr:pirin family protein [Xanthomonadaceae bacterium]